MGNASFVCEVSSVRVKESITVVARLAKAWVEVHISHALASVATQGPDSTVSTESPVPDEESAPKPAVQPLRSRVNIFFRIAAGLVGVFVVTIFSLIAVVFGDPAAPLARLLDRIGMQLIVGEMCAILIVGTLAMTVDRRTS